LNLVRYRTESQYSWQELARCGRIAEYQLKID